MRSKETVRVCDVCGKRVIDDGEIRFGGHVHNGWFSIIQTGGSTDLRSLKLKREWDACGLVCFLKLAKDFRTYQGGKP